MKSNYFNYTDAQLAELYNQQDRGAFEAIYDRYWDLLYIHAKKMLHDEDQAQDVVQDLFTNLFNKMGKLELKSAFKSFLYQSTRNQVLDLIRRDKVKFDYISSIQAYYQQGENTTDNLVLEKELSRTIEQEIAKLPPKMRAIFEMSKKAYLSNQEIAEATNTSEENVRKQIRQAVNKLRSRMTCFFCLQIMAGILWLNRHF
jgi:RNA polymerase sigma-70 factor (family 1)